MTNPNRRDFLNATATLTASLALPSILSARPPVPLGKAQSCIFINLVGGPSHIDTFDPKPDTPKEVRGPFGLAKTKVTGLQLSDLFPKLAGLADKFSLIRSMHHTAPPIHEAGFQLLNTGRLFRDGPEWPGIGSVVSYLDPPGRPGPSVYPSRHIETGIQIDKGQGAGWLAKGYEPYSPPEKKGATFADWCAAALKDVERGARIVTINMFPTVFDAPSWDCHADRGSLATNFDDYKKTVAPAFDAGFAKLLTDLEGRGLLDGTLVVATGEFGRTPLVNSNGGRDHWANAWTALVAGGGVKPGKVIGKTDAKGTEPTDRPVTPQELVATIFHALGIAADATIPGADKKPVAVYPGKPVMELF